MAAMSAIGPKQTWARALHMSAFRVRADMRFAPHMSAFDPKRTSAPFRSARLSRYDALSLFAEEAMSGAI
jgi:hypothetical protein